MTARIVMGQSCYWRFIGGFDRPRDSQVRPRGAEAEEAAMTKEQQGLLAWALAAALCIGMTVGMVIGFNQAERKHHHPGTEWQQFYGATGDTIGVEVLPGQTVIVRGEGRP